MTHFNWRAVNPNSISHSFFSNTHILMPLSHLLHLCLGFLSKLRLASSCEEKSTAATCSSRQSHRTKWIALLSLTPQTPKTRVSTWGSEVLTGKSLWGGMDGGHTFVFLRTSNWQENPATHCTWPAPLFLFKLTSLLSLSLLSLFPN